jgi:hypothetical protein
VPVPTGGAVALHVAKKSLDYSSFLIIYETKLFCFLCLTFPTIAQIIKKIKGKIDQLKITAPVPHFLKPHIKKLAKPRGELPQEIDNT